VRGDIECLLELPDKLILRASAPRNNPVPVSVAVDSLENNGRERAVKDLRRHDIKALYSAYSTANQANKPVVQVEPVVTPGNGY